MTRVPSKSEQTYSGWRTQYHAPQAAHAGHTGGAKTSVIPGEGSITDAAEYSFVGLYSRILEEFSLDRLIPIVFISATLGLMMSK